MKIIEEKYPEIHHEKLQPVFIPYVDRHPLYMHSLMIQKVV